MLKNRIATQISLWLLLSIAAPPSLLGQRGAQPDGIRRLPVTVAIVDDIDSDEAEALILRRASTNPHDVILLERDRADVPRLIAALATLVTARKLLGESVDRDVRMPVDPRTGKDFFRGRARRDLHRLIDKLASREPGFLVGVGEVPYVTVWIPAEVSIRLAAGQR